MTIYLNSEISYQELKLVSESPDVLAVKFYPAGATTNSTFGVSEFESYYRVFEHMEKLDIVLCVHGESNNPKVDVFDREARFIEESFDPMTRRFPNLRVVFEHISTSDAVNFVNDQNENVVASVTPQHLAYNRNSLLAGKLRPHKYCAPLLKKEADRSSLVHAVTADSNEKFFLGTDSAPHLIDEKESSCGCAGCFSAPFALAKYAEVFSAEGKLENLENFASLNGAKFYGLPVNKEKINLVQKNNIPTDFFMTEKGEKIVSFVHGEALDWQVVN
jgi:dihydroorotase